ncbi:TetR/AcrR family transcriptional regulator [Rhizobium sp. RM]|uniref:TetR/AcrR family transcriptional regulator n=2 Tax=Rhizobium/Agrobacterium group TaxID=227290 RepID=UPI00110E16AA|nr:TetR/AcrR family transcriptional regulator [Rhizobium sp. RM]NWJ26705.1 TetR/AcrR family transcriptional regulator [Rhizobium sp. RM]TMV22584.1 TetR/AcrR family transcriptional regulator [Rhizobium sp. Td3]
MIVFYIAIMSTKTEIASQDQRQRGRPREFDIEPALDGAIRVFSERGYHATSIGDLAIAMELAQGSIYKAFKDKKAVFIAAMDRYRTVQTERFEQAIAGLGTGRERLRAGMMFYASRSHGASGSEGCLVVGAVADLAALDDDMAAVVDRAVKAREKIISRIVREGQQDGSINPDVDADDLARSMLCLMYGMRVVGKTGRTLEQMIGVVDVAMRLAL